MPARRSIPHPGLRPTGPARRRAFTLIELILVMAILAAVLGMAAPSLARFFRGRNLDSEANRLVALARHAQSRAVSEGIPMVLWFDEKNRRYGLESDPTWDAKDAHAVSFELAEDVEFSLQRAFFTRTNGTLDVRNDTSGSTLPTIRFQPDGLFAPNSLEWILLRGRRETSENQDRLWVALGQNRLTYEVWNTQPPIERPGR